MSDAEVDIAGGCLCGAVRYRSRRTPLMVRACWCRVCQHLASGNATINVVFASDAFEITGTTQDYPSVADSGRRMHRRFCPTCGTQLFSEAEERPNLVVVRAGTLDSPGLARPQGNIWTDSAPAWAHIDPSLPNFPGQPPAVSPFNLTPEAGR